MYSNQKIPAPFNQPRHINSREEKPSCKSPAPAPEKIPAHETTVPIISAEKTPQKKAAACSSSPLLAFLLLDLFSNKEG